MTFSRRLARWVVAHLQALAVSFLLVVFAAAVFWFFASFVPDRRQAAIEGWRAALSVRGDVGRDQVDRIIANDLLDARMFAMLPDARALLSGALTAPQVEACRGRLREVLALFVEVHGVRGVALQDAAGRLAVSAGQPPPPPRSAGVEPASVRGCRERVEFARDESGRPLLAYTSPIVSRPDGEPSGCAVIAMDPEKVVYPLLSAQMIPGTTSEALLIQRGGDKILFLSHLRHRPDAPLTLQLPVGETNFSARLALEGRENFGAFVDYRGARVLAAVRRLKSAPWGLVVKVDEDEALAAFRKDVLQRGISWGALLVALLAAAVGLWRSLVISHEVKLARSEARFGALVEQATDAIFLVGSNGRVLQANDAAEVVYGWTRDELLSMHATDIRASGTRDALRHDMETAATRGSLLVETRHRRADGSEFPVEVNLGLVKAGDETLFLSIVRDITVRKAAEDRIRKLNRLLRTISEVNQVLVRATDEESLLKDVCRILVSHGGYALAWVGRADRETMRVVPVASAGDEAGYLERIDVRWDDTPEGRGPLGTAIREGRPAIVSDVQVDPMVAPWRRLHPSPGFGSITAIPIRRGGAVTAGLIVYAAEKAFVDEEELALLEELAGDLSFALDALDAREALRRGEAQLEEAQQQLQQAQKMEAVGRLAGGVAHDFNNLLTVIQGYGELLQASLEGDTEKRASVGEIVKAAERAAALTRQLLAFGRKQVLEMRVLDVGAVVAETEKMLRRLISEDVEVLVKRPAALGLVKADQGQLEQVVLNLAVNARDAMPGGGRLTLELADLDLDAPLAGAQEAIPPGRYVVLSIADTGTGMDAETLGHIFEPFFTTKERGKGTGLGLATAYGIVRQTGGYMAVETAPGAGTTFRVYLPRCDEKTTSGVRPSVRSGHGAETVLVVEDEPAVRALAKVVLERQGYTVLVAESGAAALDVVTRDARPIHVLLTDLVMPGMNGRELASRVAALRPSIKVVFMSGYTADVLTGLDVNAGQLFISKPFNEQALAGKVRDALDAMPA